jgi:hypothetical protein
MALGGALAVLLWDVFNNPRLGDTARTVWAVALCVGNVVAMPVYWIVHLRRSRSKT